MSDETQPKQDPNLTPQEQAQAEDTALIDAKTSFADFTEQFGDSLPFGFLRGGFYGDTSFEDQPLNRMLDLLESARPDAFVGVVAAMKKATKNLNEAAKDLDTFVRGVDWKGEAATEFQRYGSAVVTYAWGISKVTNAVGAQMENAGTGLTSVRNSKPPRDTRLVQKKPQDFQVVEQAADNPAYQKSLQVEKDRQEAINQMNRLASFYAVSQSTLASIPLPVPPKAYGAPVPRPLGSIRNRGDSGLGKNGGTLDRTARGGTLDHETPGTIGASTDRTNTTVPRTGGELDGHQPIRETGPGDTKVRIDSVATPPAPTLPTTAPPSTPTPVTPNPTGPGMPPPIALGTTPKTGGPRVAGAPGTPHTATGRTPLGRATGPTTSPATGRTGGPASSPATGRSGGPMGRATGPGTQSPQAGRSTPQTGRAGGPGGPAQRQGTAGARNPSPAVGRPGGPGQSVTGRTGSARSNPIVGGTPQRSSGGSTGSRIPRGTVVGGETPAGRPAAARPGQAGVVGSPSNKPGRPTGLGTSATNGVIGNQRGAGGGRGNQRPPREEKEREGTERPDYLVEDEETWTNRRRGAVPPVID
ncbi:hypothetical protein ACIQRS_00100 [Streptomyces termitum]|uniref:Uncharacterized protein n=1 Tax=Streptomyces termitum TaxID=67368 RepID=A0A918WD16_9ACTN|nr:hypothetical protein [Streptomyces termitum]GHA99285.1 hypothetical protein GCM10010305_48260 [Streptomyces termitum]